MTTSASGIELVFDKPDDAEAMRLLRDLLRIAYGPRSGYDDALLSLYARMGQHLKTPYNQAQVTIVRQQLATDDRALELSEAAHWLAMQYTNRTDFMRVVLALIDLPEEFTSVIMRGVSQRAPRGKPQRGRR